MLVTRCVYVKARARGVHVWARVGGLGEDVVHVAKRVLDDQGAQNAFVTVRCAPSMLVSRCVYAKV